jgi:hypothetical protein
MFQNVFIFWNERNNDLQGTSFGDTVENCSCPKYGILSYIKKCTTSCFSWKEFHFLKINLLVHKSMWMWFFTEDLCHQWELCYYYYHYYHYLNDPILHIVLGNNFLLAMNISWNIILHPVQKFVMHFHIYFRDI